MMVHSILSTLLLSKPFFSILQPLKRKSNLNSPNSKTCHPYPSSICSCLIPTNINPKSQFRTINNTPISKFTSDRPKNGLEILFEALCQEGATTVFVHSGVESIMLLNQSLIRSSLLIRLLFAQHEQGAIFAADGYARASGCTGACMVISSQDPTNFITGLANAMFDSIPLVAITASSSMNINNGLLEFNKTSFLETYRCITKHCFLVLDAKDIQKTVSDAFFLASYGRPGPVLIHISLDIHQEIVLDDPQWNNISKKVNLETKLLEYYSINQNQAENIVGLIHEAKKPILYVGGGCMNSSKELRRFVELTGIPLASTLMGLGAYSCRENLSLHMLGMHGTVYANYAVNKSDLLLAFGVRFDDRVTCKVEAFASEAKIVHIDIDRSEIGKIKQAHYGFCANIKQVLEMLNLVLEKKLLEGELELDFSMWRDEINQQKEKYPYKFRSCGEEILPQYAIQVLDEMTDGNAIITTGVGQHQMWAAQWYKYRNPRQLLTSGGLGAMGFGLPAAIGAAIAKPEAIVIDIDGDGSFLMNLQELVTVQLENLPIKIIIFNNQHLGMVAEWEDRFSESKRANSYLGINPMKNFETFPNMLDFAAACKIPASQVTKKTELRKAIQEMLETTGSYLLDIVIPQQEHVLPMIPPNGTFNDTIIEE